MPSSKFHIVRLGMTFIDSIKFCLTKGYVNFKDRASRSEFWWFFLFQVLISLLFTFHANFHVNGVGVAFHVNLEKYVSDWLVVLPLLLPSIAVSVRRLHDLNFSGKWMIVFVCIPLVFVIIRDLCLEIFGVDITCFSPTFEVFVDLLDLILDISCLIFIILFIFRGTEGTNRFGEDPLKDAT